MRVIALATALAHVETSVSLRQLIDATNNPTCRFLTLSFSPEMAESWMHHVHSALFRATPYPVLLGTARFALRRRHVVRFQVEVVSVLLPRRNESEPDTARIYIRDAFIDINDRLHSPDVTASEREALSVATRYLALILRVELAKAS